MPKVEPALLTNEATTPLLICSKVLFLIVKLCSLVALLKAQSRCFSLLSSWRLMACQSTVIRVQSAGSLDNCKRRRHVEPRASRDRRVSSPMMQSHTYNCSLWSIVLRIVDIVKGTTDLRVVSFCSRECFSIVKNQTSSLVVGFAWFKIVSFGLINFALVWFGMFRTYGSM